LSNFLKSEEQIQVSLKSDKNKGYFTSRSTYIFIIFCSVLLKMGTVLDKSCKENQNTFYVK